MLGRGLIEQGHSRSAKQSISIRYEIPKLSDFVSIKDHGSIGDGVEHPLSEQFSTLLAAQMVYPFRYIANTANRLGWHSISNKLK